MYDTYECFPQFPIRGLLQCSAAEGPEAQQYLEPTTSHTIHEWLLPGTTLDGLAMISKVWYLPGSPWEALKLPWEALKWVLRWTTSP